MSTYVRVILAGLVTFPLLALLLLVPYMVYEYRRYGSIPAWKTIVVFAMILYGLCALYMVILPLPESRTAFVAYAAKPKLVPFTFVGELSRAASLVGLTPEHPRTIVAFLRRPDVYITLFNVLLTVPVGFFARYLYKARWWHAVCAGLLVSLFFEVTQFTGIYGIYAHPYRLFDVDDLIVNTAGALAGFVLSLPVCRLLPDIDDVNARARERGRSYPSLTRRLLALGIDLVLAGGIALGTEAVLRADSGYVDAVGRLGALTLGVTVAFVVVPLVARGGTLGHRVLRMRVVEVDADEAPWWRVLARQALLWWGMVLLPMWMVRLFPSGSVDGIPVAGVEALVGTAWLLWLAVTLLKAAVARFRRRPFVMLCAYMSGTRLMTLPGIEAVREQVSRERRERDEEEARMAEAVAEGEGGDADMDAGADAGGAAAR